MRSILLTAAASLAFITRAMAGPLVTDPDDLIGRVVVAEDGSRIGEIYDVMIDPHGDAVEMVVHISPALQRERMVAIPVDAGRVLDDDSVAVSGVSHADVAALPVFEGDEEGVLSLGR